MEIGLLLIVLIVFGMTFKPRRGGTLTRRIIIDERGRGYLESNPFRTGRPVTRFAPRSTLYHTNGLR